MRPRPAGRRTNSARWSDIQESENGGERRFTLGPETTRRLISQARELLQGAGLIGREIASETVDLDQVAHLTAKGKERERGAGQATVKFTYAVEGLPVRGAGAKTLMFAEPENGSVRFTGAFHAWRVLGTPRTVTMPPIERALEVGLLVDPELVAYREAGHRIVITRLDVTYLALPAFMRQSHLFPAFQVEGHVVGREEGPGLPLRPLPPRRTARCVCGSGRVRLVPQRESRRDRAGRAAPAALS